MVTTEDAKTAGPVIVVGYDGSPASRAAVSFAIERVGDTGRLLILRAYRAPADHLRTPYFDDLCEALADDAERSIARLADAEPRLAFAHWEPHVVRGDPAAALCALARERGADEIVIGSRGEGRLAAVAGTVPQRVLHRADRPVTVIPRRMHAMGTSRG